MVRSNPYPGLRPFEEADAHLFFGRKKAVCELLTLLKEHRFLAVLGLSGSGKSSLIRAGLLPAMHLGAMGDEFADWRVATFQPGMDPIGSLSAALDDPKVLGPDPDGRQLLERSGRGLAERALRASLADGSYLLVFVDQFEEIFRFQKDRTRGPDEAALFVRLLLEASQQEWSRVHVLITMRSDFLGECAQFNGLPEALKQGQYLVRGMIPEERREAIEQPARLAHLTVSEELVQQVLNDAGEDPARLPVMQHALMRTCDEGKPGPLTLEHYETAGTMAHALDWHAQRLFEDLSPADQPVARRMFQCLAERRAGARDTRRPTTVGRIATACGVSEERIGNIYRHFGGNNKTFLTCRNTHLASIPPGQHPVSADGLTSKSLVDVTHESLLLNWKLLNRWIDQEEELGRRFTAVAEEWLKRPDELLDGNFLVLAKRWAVDVQQDLPGELSDSSRLEALDVWSERYPVRQGQVETLVPFSKVKELIEKSDAALSQAQTRREKLNRRNRVIRQAAVGLFVLTALLGLGFWWSLGRTNQLNTQARDLTNLTRDLASQAEKLASETQAKDVALDQAKAGKNAAEGAKTVAEELRKRSDAQRDVEIKLRQKEQDLTRTANAALDDSKRALGEARQARDELKVAIGVADDQRQDAERSAKQAEEQRKVAVARLLFATSASLRAQKASLLPTSLAIGLAALQSVDMNAEIIKQASDAWRRAFALLPRPVHQVLLSPQERLSSFAVTPNGDMLALTSVVPNRTTIKVYNGEGQAVNELVVPGGPVTNLVFSPDGKYLAAMGGRRVLVWETRSWTSRTANHTADVNVVAFARDSQLFATGSDDRTACIWKAAGVEQVRCIQHPGEEYVTTLDFSPDGQRLATGTDENYARVWEVASGRRVAEVVHTARVNAVRFSPDGKTVASASGDRSVRLWDSSSGKTTAPALIHPGPVNQVEFGRTDRLATAGSDNTVRLWTMMGRPVASLTHENRIQGITFSPDGKYVATASADNTGRIWDVTRGTETWRAVHDGLVLGIRFTADSRHFVTASADRSAEIWEIPNGPEVVRTIEGGADKAAFGGRDTIAVIGGDKELRLVNLSRPAGPPARKGQFHTLAFSQDGRYVAAAAEVRGAARDEIQLIESISQESRAIGAPPSSTKGSSTRESLTRAMAFDREEKYLAIGGDTTVRIWRVSDGHDLGYTLKHEDLVDAVAFSPDGRYVATGGDDAFARVWDVTTGESVARLPHGTTEYVIALQFSADGEKLATGTDENVARVWRWRDGVVERTFRHADAVMAVVFDREGKRLATTSDDNTARVWDLATGSEKRFDLASPGRAVAFTAEDQKLTTVTLNGTVGTWNLAAEDLVNQACSRLPRNLNSKEWETYIGTDLPFKQVCPALR